MGWIFKISVDSHTRQTHRRLFSRNFYFCSISAIANCHNKMRIILNRALFTNLPSFHKYLLVGSAQVLRLHFLRQIRVVVLFTSENRGDNKFYKCTAFGKNINRFWYIRQVLQSAFLLKLTWQGLWMFDLPHRKSPISYCIFEAMLISVIPVEIIYHFLSINQNRAFVFLFVLIYFLLR